MPRLSSRRLVKALGRDEHGLLDEGSAVPVIPRVVSSAEVPDACHELAARRNRRTMVPVG